MVGVGIKGENANMVIRELTKKEWKEAFELVWRVFLEFEAQDYGESGIEEFRSSLKSPVYLSMLEVFGAFLENKIVGVIATRKKNSHIALFFVDKDYQGQGVGRKLFDFVVGNNKSGELTVNASPFAVDIYHHFGFVDTDTPKNANGVIYIPMKLSLEI